MPPIKAWLELEGMPKYQVKLGDHLGVHQPGADRLGDRGAGDGAEEVQRGRHQDGLQRRQHPGGDHGGDGVGSVVKAVDEVEDQRQHDHDHQGDERAMHT
jgi:hypothetical protein